MAAVFTTAENVGRLKQLQYLNLALNNVTRIENLEGVVIQWVWSYSGGSGCGHTVVVVY